MDNQLTLYCNCFDQHPNRSTQFNQVNLICGADNLSTDIQNQYTSRGFILDNTGHSLSQHNRWLGDLTGLYWVWKNTADEFVGTNQYRRFWINSEVERLNLLPDVMYIAAVQLQSSVIEQFTMHHGHWPLLALRDAANQGRVPIKSYMIDDLNNTNNIAVCNMFYGHRPLFDKTCEILFDTILELFEKSWYALPYVQPPGQTRALAFLAERVCTMIFRNYEYFTGRKIDINVVPYEVI